ncbi:MAG: aminoglycoside phosphotransferase family protein [Chloroflexota bacterium]|nr:aminoglycoside phosphotransferase family protein [Chloroflexota bacterium]
MVKQHPFDTPGGGGVSGELLFVDGPDGPIVVKRALPKLKVAADWFASPKRSAVEAACLRVLADVLGQDCVPRVLWVDEQAHSFAMQRLPDRYVVWKARLLRCDVDLTTAARVGQLLGQMHTRTSDRPDLAEQFDNRAYLFDLRIRPYHQRVAERQPRLAEAIDGVVQRMLLDRRCLVHGDFSPKNLLTDGPAVVVLDCEVAHWGDPRFDVAFCLSHLLLKTLHSASCSAGLAQATTAYLDAYAEAGLKVLDQELSRATGCLVLARVVGDSPVDYLHTPALRDAAFRLGEGLLVDPPAPGKCVERALENRMRSSC